MVGICIWRIDPNGSTAYSITMQPYRSLLSSDSVSIILWPVTFYTINQCHHSQYGVVVKWTHDSLNRRVPKARWNDTTREWKIETSCWRKVCVLIVSEKIVETSLTNPLCKRHYSRISFVLHMRFRVRLLVIHVLATKKECKRGTLASDQHHNSNTFARKRTIKRRYECN